MPTFTIIDQQKLINEAGFLLIDGVAFPPGPPANIGQPGQETVIENVEYQGRTLTFLGDGILENDMSASTLIFVQEYQGELGDGISINMGDSIGFFV